METTNERVMTFRVPGREPLKGVIKNPDATLGKVAASVAQRQGLAGTYECLSRDGESLSPDMRLADLPDDEITLASDLTPA